LRGLPSQSASWALSELLPRRRDVQYARWQ